MIAKWCSGLTAACVLSAAAFLAGCSSSTRTVSGTPVTVSSAGVKSAVCKSADNLKASITGLKDVNIRVNGTSAVSAQVTKIKQDFDALKTDAKGQFSAQVTGLSNALNTLESKLNEAKASPNAGTLSALASAAGSVVTAGTSLVTAVTSAC